jgi:hypothetical protein
MKCNRCGGMMVFEKFYHQPEQCWGWRCVYRAEYLDSVIWKNRRFQDANRRKDRQGREDAIHKSGGEECGTRPTRGWG